MAINLLDIKPHKVSKDLSGYITFIYGAPKTGKTTLATQMNNCLLIATEKGYNALPGVMAQDVTSWSEIRQVYRELKKDEVKKTFDAIIIDTVDIAAEMCQKYICNQNDIEALGELPYGQGWTKFKAEFNDVFRGLTQLGYAVFFIGHHKEQTITVDGEDRIYIRSAMSNSTRSVITGMADIFGYAHQQRGRDMSVLTLRSPDDTIECGGRFKYLPNEIEMSYDNLVNALAAAIDKEAAETDGKFVTDEKIDNSVQVKEYDFDAMITEFQTLVEKIMTANQSNGMKITAIVDKYLGKGKKVGDATPTPCEQIDLILIELREMV
jgi:nicotinamide riboside kinase